MHATRLNTLTSLRFFAASMIVLLHMNGTFWPSANIQGFTTGVSFFFVLSGFILRMVYGELRSMGEVRQFYVARIARLWPMHLLSIGLLLLTTGTTLPSWNITAANLLLLQSWIPHPDWYFSLNGVAWSISTELAFYAIFPLLTWRLERNWPIKIALAVAGIAVCAIIYPTVRPANDDEALLVLAGLIYINPVARVFEFLVGMLCAVLYYRISHRINGSRAIWTVGEVSACTLVVGCVAYAWPTFQSLSPYNPQLAEWVLQSGQFWVLALLIFVFAIGRGALSTILVSRPLVFLGEISFAMYMLHQVIIRAMEDHAKNFIAAYPGLSTAIYVSAVLLSSAATFLLFEKPIRKFIVTRVARRPSSDLPTRSAEHQPQSSPR
ncbi:acyltransferase family protein [Burkholderia arboris]|uniref:acyltransferase family protein n=1 Tax=Burkholderia arboris TaxID=488730 RepID=UPI001CF4D4A2|nr:acyltransferase [Burkholderia arboris]MCA8045464.1 acyltransferase [Burkholderia arboris]